MVVSYSQKNSEEYKLQTQNPILSLLTSLLPKDICDNRILWKHDKFEPLKHTVK